MRRVRLSFPLTVSASCMLVCGLIVSFALFFWVYRQEQHDERVNFERRAQLRLAAVQQGMSKATDALQVVNQLFETNGSVSAEQFKSFTQPLRARLFRLALSLQGGPLS